MIPAAHPSVHVLRHLVPVRPLGPGRGHRRRRLHFRAHAAAPRDEEAATEAPSGGGAELVVSSSSPGSLRVTATTEDSKKPAAGLTMLSKDYSHTLFRSECLEVLGMVDLESLRKRPRLTVGITVKASVVLPVLVVLAILYLTDMANGVVDWTPLGGEDVAEGD